MSSHREQISSLVSNGLKGLEKLLEALDSEGPSLEAKIAHAHLARFKLWAGSLGAHRSSGTRSLEYRLRDASSIRHHLVSLLTELKDLLVKEALPLVHSNEAPRVKNDNEEDDMDDELAAYFGEDDEDEPAGSVESQDNELGQILSQIGGVIDCLLRLSVTISNPAPHDRFKSRAGVEAISYEPWDVEHVRAKFPRLDGKVSERLGKTLTQRRRYFKYREDHHCRLKQGLDDIDDGASKGKATTVASSLPQQFKDEDAQVNLIVLDDDRSEISATSYAPSTIDDTELRVPPIPKEYVDGPFLCPFCYVFISVDTRHEWKKHVFRDLRPYVCLSETCTVLDHDFQRRKDWSRHMFQEHWRVWTCPFGCAGSFSSSSTFRRHLNDSHSTEITGETADSMISLSSKADLKRAEEKCPLCHEVDIKSSRQYQSHVGHHLEQLALFVLPLQECDEDNDVSDDETEDEADTSSLEGTAEEVGTHPQKKAVEEHEETQAMDEPVARESLIHLENPVNLEANTEDSPVDDGPDQAPEAPHTQLKDHDSQGPSSVHSTAPQSHGEGPSSTQPLLSKALQNANAAVQLDNVQDLAGARAAYQETCDTLQQVLERTSRGEDRKKVEALLKTYVGRIEELGSSNKPLPTQEFDLATTPALPITPKHPLQDVTRDTEFDSVRQLSEDPQPPDEWLSDFDQTDMIRTESLVTSALNAVPENSDYGPHPLPSIPSRRHQGGGDDDGIVLQARASETDWHMDRTQNQLDMMQKAVPLSETERWESVLEMEAEQPDHEAYMAEHRKAVDDWRIAEAQRRAREEEEEEEEEEEREAEREFRKRMHERLLASGLPENQIEDIMKGKRLASSPNRVRDSSPSASRGTPTTEVTYTRMARKHLSLEALREKAIDFELDEENPDYVVIKRWVPPDEQKALWARTRVIRLDRNPEIEPRTTRLNVDYDRLQKRRRRSASLTRRLPVPVREPAVLFPPATAKDEGIGPVYWDLSSGPRQASLEVEVDKEAERSARRERHKQEREGRW